MDRRRAALIWNPAAGKGGASLDEVRRRLEPGFELLVFETTKGCDADGCAERAIAAGAQLVIAAGGDGTVSLAASKVIGTARALGILPRGTSNSIAGAAGIPTDVAGACDTLLAGHTVRLDTGLTDRGPMVLHCSVGLHARLVGNTTREAKSRWGRAAYLMSALKELDDLEPFDVELETEDVTVKCQATAVTIANLAPRRSVLAHGPSAVSPLDGQLAVTVLAATTLVGAVRAGLELFRTAGEAPAKDDRVGYFGARRVRVRTGVPQRVLIDGEQRGFTPLEVACLPASLLLVAPPGQLAEDEPEERLHTLPGLEVTQRR